MTIYLITNAVKRQKLHVHLSIVLQLLGDYIPQTPIRALPLHPAGRLPSSKPPVPTLLPNPGYAAAKIT